MLLPFGDPLASGLSLVTQLHSWPRYLWPRPSPSLRLLRGAKDAVGAGARMGEQPGRSSREGAAHRASGQAACGPGWPPQGCSLAVCMDVLAAPSMVRTWNGAPTGSRVALGGVSRI